MSQHIPVKRSTGHHHHHHHHRKKHSSCEEFGDTWDVSSTRTADELALNMNDEANSSSFCVQRLLGDFLMTKLEAIEQENRDVSQPVVGDSLKKLKPKTSHKSSRKTGRSPLPVDVDLSKNVEFKYSDSNLRNLQSDSRNPSSLNVWNRSEYSSSHAFDDSILNRTHEDFDRSCKSRMKESRRRASIVAGPTESGETLRLCETEGSRRSCQRSDIRYDFAEEPQYWNEGEIDVRHGDRAEYWPASGTDASQTQVFAYGSHLQSLDENPKHEQGRKRKKSKDSKERGKDRHKEKRKKRSRKDSLEVSGPLDVGSRITDTYLEHVSPGSQYSRYGYHKGSWGFEVAADGVERFASSQNDFSEDHLVKRSRKIGQAFDGREQYAGHESDEEDFANRTWDERYNQNKRFKRDESCAGATSGRKDNESISEFKERFSAGEESDCGFENHSREGAVVLPVLPNSSQKQNKVETRGTNQDVDGTKRKRQNKKSRSRSDRTKSLTHSEKRRKKKKVPTATLR